MRFKPASFVGTFVALMMSALVVAACGVLLETSIRASVPAERYANAPVVAAADQSARVVADTVDGPEETAYPLPDTARVDAGLAAKAAQVPGAATAVPDFTFPVRGGGAPAGALTGHGWGSHAFTGTELTRGTAPHAGEVVLGADAARTAEAGVGDTVVLETADGRAGFRVSGLAEAGAGDLAKEGVEGVGGAATAWFADAEAPVLAGHPGKADAIAVMAEDGVGTDALADAVGKALTGTGARTLTGDDRGEVEDHGLAYGKETLFAVGGSFGGIATLVAVFTAAGTVALSVGQRTREFALLRAVGATPRQVRRAVAAEALLVAP
ncbi:ABC transporter permease, partial [Streptomyces coelicoflavus]|nr:ABC transporter permease [Streptomyces coelicoflavus]